MSLTEYISRVSEHENLSVDDMQIVVDHMVSGEADPVQVGGFLTAQYTKGITADELQGAVAALRQHMIPFKLPASIARDNIVDCCGTGGDGKHTLNVSTAVAFVVAGAGVPVVKHGNRSVSSKSGSSDVLSELGVNVNASDDRMREALEAAKVCFLNAPKFHPAMKHVAPIRASLKTRTLFNLVGPLLNPAEPRRQLVGVYDEKWLAPFADVLDSKGVHHAMVVTSKEGHDELSLLENAIRSLTIPQSIIDVFGAADGYKVDISGGDSAYNAKRLREMFSSNGPQDHYYKMVIFNAAALLIIAGKTAGVDEAFSIAEESINSGAALNALDTLAEITN